MDGPVAHIGDAGPDAGRATRGSRLHEDGDPAAIFIAEGERLPRAEQLNVCGAAVIVPRRPQPRARLARRRLPARGYDDPVDPGRGGGLLEDVPQFVSDRPVARGALWRPDDLHHGLSPRASASRTRYHYDIRPRTFQPRRVCCSCASLAGAHGPVGRLRPSFS